MKYLSIFFLFLLVGCGGTAFKASAPDEIPAGPGLFSKKEGAVVFYNSEQSERAKPLEKTNSLKADTDTSSDDFEQFKRWQEWKTNPDKADEQDEFRQWQEYQKYKQQK